MRGTSRIVGSIALCVAVLVAGLSALPVGAAVTPLAATYTGGVYDHPLYVADDHTPFALRWEATGLPASTSFYVKMRLTVGTSPSPSSNRGFTWNDAAEAWIQESDSWSSFPTVSSDASGEITGASGWLFGKFGDEEASGEYHIMVSLKPTGGGDTLNPTDPPLVTVLDMETEGSWVHNGADTGAAEAKRAEVTSSASATAVFGLSKTEANLIDDDSNGTPDDEDLGPAGSAGDFRFALPTSTQVDITLNKSLWLDDATTGAPDCDIALGAGDVSPPGMVTGLDAESSETSITLTWNAATGAASYRIYRWADPSDTKSSPVHAVIAEVTGTTHNDASISPGTKYYYEVRAVDGASNVGPRSETVANIETHSVETERVSGATRFETAAAISEATFDTAGRVVLATGANYPDALAAAGLSGAYNCPLLLVSRDLIPDATLTEMSRLGVKNVVLVGGEGAISEEVESQLGGDYSVSRIAGADRYETAAEIASEVVRLTGSRDAFFARGDGFADALAAGPYAYGSDLPILLVRPGSVPGPTADAIDELALQDGVVVGGIGAISESVFGSLDSSIAGTLERISGDTRYETAAALAEYAVGGSGICSASWEQVGLATGQNFPDALSGGAAIGSNAGVILLTRTTSLPTATSALLEGNKETIDTTTILGGTGAIDRDVEEEVYAIFE